MIRVMSDKKMKGQKDKKKERQKDEKTKRQIDEKTKGKKTKNKKRVLYCDVRAVSHSCNVFIL